MDVKLWFKEYLSQYTPRWNYEDGCVLKAVIDLYKETGEAEYRQFAMDCMFRFGAEDGGISGCEVGQNHLDLVNTGKSLFFALEETGEERYRRAIEFCMQQLRCGSAPEDSKALYAAGPFFMAYEMKCGGMEKVADVVRLFKGMHNDGQRPDGWRLMALADAIGWCREELYEHYRALVDIFREELAEVLRHPADEADAKVAYALLKAVRLGLIDPEKYLPIAYEKLAAVQEHLSSLDGAEAVGVFMMAYSEYLQAE